VRRVEVPADRLATWLSGFDARHEVTRSAHDGAVARFWGADGTVAECHVPFPPLGGTGLLPELLVEHVQRERTVGVLLVRLGGHAAAVCDGERLVAWKVGRRPVHGRHATGGWSQHRFARRREGQARVALVAAADAAAAVLVPALPALESVVLGGDRRAVRALRGDPRLAGVLKLATGGFLATPDPTPAVLRTAPRRFRAVLIRVIDPEALDPSLPSLQ
jgi:hypothetical protein